MTTISIQGDKASFHDIAAMHFFDTSDRVYCTTFKETFAALDSGASDYALCAIENSLYGSINEVYGLLLESGYYIFGEVYLRIEQCLIATPGTKIADIQSVYSHPVALAQCEPYLVTHLPGAALIEYHDTAASVEFVKQQNNPTVAAIASSEASFVLTTSHQAGALHAALGCFTRRSINLSKLQSQPIIGQAWNYMFYIDIDAGIDSPAATESFEELERQGCTITILGSYIAAPTQGI
jgi:prephenate dehydratase